MPDFAVRTSFTAVDKISPAFNRMGGAAETFTKKTSGLFSGLAGQLGLFGGFALVAMGFKKVVSEAANFENSVANFTTLLGGSQSEAEKLVNTLQVLGAETPFQFKDLSDATQRLLGFGVATKDTVAPTLRMLGDLAQGNAEKLQGISLVYGQIMAGGKMMGQDFNQLINQGVPIAQGLAKVWGVDVNEAIKRVKQNGPVAAKDVQAAMVQMTSAGGMFYQGMMRSSKTLTGLWSTFMDAIGMTASVIGQELLPYLKDVVVWATNGMTAIMNFTKENKQVIGFLIKSIPWVVGALVAWKVATYAVAAAQLFMTGLGWIQYLYMMWPVILKAVGATNAWELAQWALNAALNANPIGLIVAGIVLSIWWINKAIEKWDTYGKAMLWLMGPIGWITMAIVALSKNWDNIAGAFVSGWETVKEKFITAGNILWDWMKAFGRGFMTYMLFPINLLITGVVKLLDLASNIPGIGSKFAKAAEYARSFQNQINSATGATNVFAPNKSSSELQAGNTNVNVYNSSGVRSEIKSNNKNAKINMTEMMGYNY